MSNALNVSSKVINLPMALHDTQTDQTASLDVTDSGLMQCGKLYGASDSMKKLFCMIGKVAPRHANVLIIGESGTGKELVAEAIHQMSQDSQQPFVALNCGAVSPQLIEAELFGH